MPEIAQPATLPLAFKLATRELRGGLRGFMIFIGCIALGVAAIAGVNSVANSITSGISSQGQAILGGDMAVTLVQRELTREQLAFFESKGTISKQMTMRAMARAPDGSDQTLIELKAVDDNYPLYGEFIDSNDAQIRLQTGQMSVDGVLLERFDVPLQSEIMIGTGSFNVATQIQREPDRVGDNVGFGPKVLIRFDDLEMTNLLQPGSLFRYHYKIRLDDPSAENINSIIEEAKEKFPDAGWRLRSRENAAPALSRSVERFSQFLTLVGLTSLVVGGVGVANATRAFLETKRPVIATLKSVGASGNLIFLMYLFQIMIMAALGVIIGLALAMAMPYAARSALGDLLPVSDGILFFPLALALGAFYGFLTALIFAIWPLAVSQKTKPTELFRASSYSSSASIPSLGYLALLALSVGTLIFVAVYFADQRFIAIVFVGAIAASFILLRVVSMIIQAIAKRAPRSKSTITRMAVANIHRPGALTPSVVLSLGLGLALLVALATIDGNLRNQIEDNLPDDAPDFFFIDVQNHEIDAFRETLKEYHPEGKIISVPMLRGRVMSLNGTPASEYKVVSGGEWVLTGDRGITYAKRIPENSTLSEGTWWEEDYSGPPLVSVAAEEARELGLDIGDKLVFNILGRNIEAEIASFREVQWESMGINFVFVFSPNTFAGAPHSFLSTLTTFDNEDGSKDGALLKGLSKTFPTVTSVRIRDALDTVNGLISQLSTAIRAAALVALFSSVLVLAGALAAGNRERIHDAVVLKTLGATRPTLLGTMILEYALLGLATAIFAILAGSVAAWFVISVIMQFEFVVLPVVSATTIAAALGLTIILGLAGTWRILGEKASPYLREL